MAEKYKLSKTLLNKKEVSKVINLDFTTFSQPTTEQDTDTIQELFRLYDKLYLEIPLQGPQSHEYLIEESSKLVSITQDLDIQPLLDEISELRQRLLDANEEILNLENQLGNGSI